MDEIENLVHLRVNGCSPALIKLFRQTTDWPLNQIKIAMEANEWIEVAKLHGLDHDEHEDRLKSLIQELDNLMAHYEIMVAGEVESKEYLSNVLSRWHDIADEQSMMTDLELGKPSVETLMNAKSRMPIEIFKETLKLVINEWNDKVDSETLEWAKNEYEKM